MEERPTDCFCFMHAALGIDFQDKSVAAQSVCSCVFVRGVWEVGGGGVAGREKAFPGICAFTLKIKPSKNPVGKKSSSWQLYWGSIDKNSQCAWD